MIRFLWEVNFQCVFSAANPASNGMGGGEVIQLPSAFKSASACVLFQFFFHVFFSVALCLTFIASC